MMDYYKSFANDYDEFGSIKELLGDEKNFFCKLFKEHEVNTILDCSCGTGQHLYMLSQMDYQLWGSDYSQSMLIKANERLSAHGQKIPLYQCDFRFLESVFDIKFDAILCLTTSLPHLHTDEDLLLAITSMKNRLNPGGLLILTSGTTHYTLGLPPIEVVVNREDFSRIFIKEHTDKFQTIHILDLYHGPQRMENNQYDIVYRILLDDDYRKLLQRACFENIQVYGDYDMYHYDKNSSRLIVVAKR